MIAGIASLFIYGIASVVISLMTRKIIFLRRFFIGVPTLLMENGKIIESGLRKCRIDVNELLSEARVNGFFDLTEVNIAIMETDGRISFLPHEWAKPSNKKDLKIKAKDSNLVANVIIDGVCLIDNLRAICKDREWLIHELKVNGYNDINDVLLATIDDKMKFTIYGKNIESNKSTILE